MVKDSLKKVNQTDLQKAAVFKLQDTAEANAE